MRKLLSIIAITLTILAPQTFASPIISGISTNEINIDHKFLGAQILLFGAKGDAGNIIITVRGPKRNFLVTKKEKLLGIWYNGDRVKFKEAYTFYSLFSTFSDQEPLNSELSEMELGNDNLEFSTSAGVSPEKKNEFKIHLISQLEKNHLYTSGANKIDFLDETLFKVMLDFPKNISRGTYTVEIYLIHEGNLLSFQSIPIYVNQVGLSAKILDFAHEESFIYGLIAVAIALIAGWTANYLFARFIGK